MNKTERNLIAASNLLLILAIASRSMLCEYAAWFLWLTILFLDIRRDGKSKGKIVIYGVVAILILCYLTIPLWRK